MAVEVFASSFAGALFGLFTGFGANIGVEFAKHHLTKNRERESRVEIRSDEAMLLSDALYGEIRCVRDVIKQYQMIAEEYLRDGVLIEAASEQLGEPDHLASDLHSLGSYEAKVYERRLGDIGLLWKLLARETTEFYGRFDSLKCYASRIANAPSKSRQDRLRRLVNECEAVRWEAHELLRGLWEFSRNHPYPKKRPRTLNGLLTDPDTIDQIRSETGDASASPPPLQEPELEPRHTRPLPGPLRSQAEEAV